MAKYTIELRTLVENKTPIFDFPYMFYDEAKKEDFEKRFVRHFYTREIGFETVGLFKLMLENTFNETLPYYNMLFQTAQINYDKLNNYDVTETYKKTNENANSNNVTNSQNVTQNSNDNVNDTSSSTTTDNINEQLNGSQTLSSVNKSQSSSSSDNSSSGENTSTNKNFTNGKTVTSETPNALLSVADVKKNIYATNVDMNDSETTQETKDKKKLTEENTSEASTLINNSQTTDDTTKRTGTNTQSSSNQYNSSKNSSLTNNVNGTTNVNANSNGTETFERKMRGNIGVMTSTDLLEKHIQLQKTLTHIERDFFNECESLFMQIF